MKIGEVYQYRLDDRLQTVRRERGHYLAYSERVKCVCRLQELPFRVLRASIEGKIDALAASARKRFRLTPLQARRLIREMQSELRELGLIAAPQRPRKRPA